MDVPPTKYPIARDEAILLTHTDTTSVMVASFWMKVFGGLLLLTAFVWICLLGQHIAIRRCDNEMVEKVPSTDGKSMTSYNMLYFGCQLSDVSYQLSVVRFRYCIH